MENIKNLLSRVAYISKKNAEILDATGGRFNMFRVCGVNHYENTHSAIIAEFLNPQGSHGLKSKLLECFIETLGDCCTVKNFNCEKAKVYTEYSIHEGRIDILIEDSQGKAIIIENKIYANDQWEQLKRYNEYAKRTYKNAYQLLYLTLSGNEASKDSGEGINYLPVSYEKTIISWLEKCVAIAVHFPMVRETINQYINHLKQLTNQDMDTKNKEEIVSFILMKPENVDAAISIAHNLGNVKKHIVEEFVNNISKEIQNNEPPFFKDSKDEFPQEFGFPYKNFYIYFGFDNGKTYASIKTKQALNGEATLVKKTDFFDKTADSYNPYGWTVIFKQHWETDDSLYVEILKGDCGLKYMVIDYYKKMKKFIDDLETNN